MKKTITYRRALITLNSNATVRRNLDIFTLSSVLAEMFNKDKRDTIKDIVKLRSK